MQTLAAAFKYLTVGDLSGSKPAPEMVGKSAGYFPLIGLFFGLLLALLNYTLTPYLAAEVINLLVIVFLISVTGAKHLNGVKRTFDALGANSLRGETNGALGVAAIVLVILGKSAAANSMDATLTVSFLLMPVLARWALVILLYGYARRFDEVPRRIAEQVKFWPILMSTAATLALITYLLGRKGLWIALLVSLFTLFLRAALYRRHSVLSHPNVHASVELTEMFSLIVLASL